MTCLERKGGLPASISTISTARRSSQTGQCVCNCCRPNQQFVDLHTGRNKCKSGIRCMSVVASRPDPICCMGHKPSMQEPFQSPADFLVLWLSPASWLYHTLLNAVLLLSASMPNMCISTTVPRTAILVPPLLLEKQWWRPMMKE